MSCIKNFGSQFGQVTTSYMLVPNIVSIITEVSFSVHTKICISIHVPNRKL